MVTSWCSGADWVNSGSPDQYGCLTLCHIQILNFTKDTWKLRETRWNCHKWTWCTREIAFSIMRREAKASTKIRLLTLRKDLGLGWPHSRIYRDERWTAFMSGVDYACDFLPIHTQNALLCSYSCHLDSKRAGDNISCIFLLRVTADLPSFYLLCTWAAVIKGWTFITLTK
jgi:hypothetical protein